MQNASIIHPSASMGHVRVRRRGSVRGEGRHGICGDGMADELYSKEEEKENSSKDTYMSRSNHNKKCGATSGKPGGVDDSQCTTSNVVGNIVNQFKPPAHLSPGVPPSPPLGYPTHVE